MSNGVTLSGIYISEVYSKNVAVTVAVQYSIVVEESPYHPIAGSSIPAAVARVGTSSGERRRRKKFYKIGP